MPENIINVIRFSGDSAKTKEMLDKIKNDSFGTGTVDFNKIAEMPPHLRLADESGSKTHGASKLLYEWSIENWGTKWNAYGYYKDVDYSRKSELIFQTAWSAPHKAVEKLSLMFPDIEFRHEWADEDIGENCGRFVYLNGKRTDEFFPENNIEKIEFAAHVTGTAPEEYGLFINASGNGYVCVDNEEYELVNVLGRQALFTDERLTESDIPEGLYCSHIRESDDGSRFVSVEPRVIVNHGGSLITVQPFDFGTKEFIVLDEENGLDFTGEKMTAGAFMFTNDRLDEDMNI